MKQMLKEKLKVTKVPRIELDDSEGNENYFKDFFKFEEFLGVGAFGFVVKA
jgi:uncharacterized protein YrzB (UPF0473 family)